LSTTTNPDNTKNDQKKKEKEKDRNDKMTTNNTRSVKNACWKHQRCLVEHRKFLFSSNRGHENIED
jgi:hypothetical protein